MTAGSIAVPNVIALTRPENGLPRNCLLADTLVEIKSETPNTDVYYTVSGRAPEPFAPLGTSPWTMKYKQPVCLPVGRTMVKAVAMSKDGMRESRLMSRSFLVQGDAVVAKEKRRSRSARPSSQRVSLFQPGSTLQKLSDRQEISSVVNPGLASTLMCCISCCAPRARDQKSKFCSQCGTMYPDAKIKPKSTVAPTKMFTERQNQLSIHREPPIEILSPSSQLPMSKKCMTCKTQNPEDSKFCGFCGKKFQVEHQCAQCSAIAPPGTLFCQACGSLLTGRYDENEKPSSTRYKTRVIKGDDQIADSIVKGSSQFSVQNVLPAVKKPMAAAEPMPSLQPVSPGKGYWRQQLNHVTNHLKTYAQNHKEFQSLVSGDKIGQIKSANVEVDSSQNLFTLSVTFDLVAGQSAQMDGVRSKYKEAAKKVSRASNRISRRNSWDSLLSQTGSRKSTARTTASRSSSRYGVRRIAKLSEQSENLLKEIQMPEKDTEEVERWLEEGADANAKDRDGVPMLGVAVKNSFLEAIEPLIEAGAKIDEQFGQHKSSALHEAVLLGPPGKKITQLLLRLGADAQLENKRGESPQMLAIKYGYTDLANVLAAHVSQKLLRRSNLSLPGSL